MSRLPIQRRTLMIITVVAPLLALFMFVALRSGPMAPVDVTISSVESRELAPALFGIGAVQARYTYKIGSTFAGRIKTVHVNVGDSVIAGQLLGEMDSVDLDDRIVAQQAAIKSAEAAMRQAAAKQVFASTQLVRYQQLFAVRGTSEENIALKQQDLSIADAALLVAREEIVRLRAELEALRTQRSNLQLLAPVAGLVTSRTADPGTTVVAGQAVIEVIDPASLWIDVRFDQISADGLKADLPASITLRSRRNHAIAGTVMRVEPRADFVTEETLAKIVFDQPPEPLPPLGELTEVSVQLDRLPAAPTIPNAAIRAVDGQRGVWTFADGKLAFSPVTLGRSDLDGRVQILQGLNAGQQVVVYSEKTLNAKSRIHVVERLAVVSP